MMFRTFGVLIAGAITGSIYEWGRWIMMTTNENGFETIMPAWCGSSASGTAVLEPWLAPEPSMYDEDEDELDEDEDTFGEDDDFEEEEGAEEDDESFLEDDDKEVEDDEEADDDGDEDEDF